MIVISRSPVGNLIEGDDGRIENVLDKFNLERVASGTNGMLRELWFDGHISDQLRFIRDESKDLLSQAVPDAEFKIERRTK